MSNDTTNPDHPLPWRTGHKLDSTHLGPVTIYDGHPDGDGGESGRFVGVMFSPELAQVVVAAVNAYGERDELAHTAS